MQDEFSERGRSRRFCPGWWILPGCVLAVCLGLFASAGLAQPAPQQQTPREQALTAKLIQEINENLQMATDLRVAQQEMQKLQAELAKAKEPEKAPDTKKP